MTKTFLGVPKVSIDDITCDTIALIGSSITSKSYHRTYGQEIAADKIREYSIEYTGFLDYLGKCIHDWDVVDLGNYNREDIGDVIKEALDRGSRVIVFGGDHLTTYYTLERIRPDNLIMLDAHFDYAEYRTMKEISHMSTTRLLREKGWKVTIYGTRGYSSICEEYQWAKKDEVIIKPWYSISIPMKDTLEKAKFISIDLDFFDSLSFPAVRVPEIGGPAISDFVRDLRETRDFNPIYVDIVEYAPDLDPYGVYGKAIVALLIEIIGKIIESNVKFRK